MIVVTLTSHGQFLMTPSNDVAELQLLANHLVKASQEIATAATLLQMKQEAEHAPKTDNLQKTANLTNPKIRAARQSVKAAKIRR